MESSQVVGISPLEIRTGNGDRVTIFHGFPESIRRRRKLAGFESMHAPGDFGHMGFHHFAGNGFSIWASEYNITRPVDFISRGQIAMLELSIPLSANIHSSWNGREPEFLRDEQFELSYVPFADYKNCFRKAGNCRTFDIHYSREYLDRFAANYPALGYFLESVDRGEPVSLNTQKRLMNAEMKRLVSDILSFNLMDQLAMYFYEAGALMLLTLVLDRIHDEEKKRVVKYSDHELESATHARNLLINDFSEKYNIRELARKTGTSETKLQLVFKHIYGTTIFDYAQSARLDFAKRLLLDTDNPIQSIAENCGYPDNSNLTAAFRKRFGCSPESFRTKGR